jgi:hypothetical protein
MTIADETDYFEAELTSRFGNRTAVSAYRDSDQVLLGSSVLTPGQAKKLADYLLKASKLAKAKKIKERR